MTQEPLIRNMSRAEVEILVQWAAREGWNPGLHDAGIFWENDPQAFIAAESGGELIGGGAITAYGQQYGFMGFFIVRPEHRGKGLGNGLWHARRDRLLARLRPGASIGLDGVFAMQNYYAAGGFELSHRNMRFRAHDPAESLDAVFATDEVVPLSAFPLAELVEYDRSCFPAPRERFLKDGGLRVRAHVPRRQARSQARAHLWRHDFRAGLTIR